MPTLEQWADSITAVLDALGSREAVLIAPALATSALFAATYPSRTTALIALECEARTLTQEETVTGVVDMWGTGQLHHRLNPDMPWNEEIRAAWARDERLAASPRTAALMLPLAAGLDVRAVLPTIRVPTLVLQHAGDAIIVPDRGKDVAARIPVSLRCCSPTSWTRRAGPPRWVTVTGMRCLMRTTPSCAYNSTASVAAR
jgi:pimeloyl-ACP methyl ester carboxylesterase